MEPIGAGPRSGTGPFASRPLSEAGRALAVSRLALERGFWLAAAREAAEAVQLAVAALEPSRAEGAVAPPDGRCPILGEAEARRAAERAEGLLALAAERAGKTI